MDRRFRPLPFGHQAVAGAVSGPPDRRPDHDALRTVARLHARRAKGIVVDLPRKQLALSQHRALAARLATENYGTALVMPRTWKSALAPMLAGIPERVGFAGEFRFGLLNDIRFGEKRLPRMIDRCGALALPRGAALPAEWPKPELNVPAQKAKEWCAARGLG
jgi:heptosyltransferase-2